MWETVTIIVFVAVAIVFLLGRMLRMVSGKTACQEGICEGCRAAGSCAEKPSATCPLKEGEEEAGS